MRNRLCFLMLTLILIGALAAGILIGRYPLSLHAVGAMMAGHGAAETRAVLLYARLPRLIGAMVVGAALSVSGSAFQAVFRNPLVSPDLLGVLSGAAFGAALAILLHGSSAVVGFSAFAGGCCAVACGFGIARLVGREGILPLLLGGLISAALFTSFLSLLKYVADPFDQLPAIIYWLLGSLARTQWAQLAWVTPLCVLGMALLWLGSRALDALVLSDDEARSLGLPVGVMRLVVLALATSLGALTVSMAGIIGWVGLIVPHMARLIIGPGHRLMLPFAALMGAAGLMLADTAARSLTASEIPLGMMTELFGALGFIVVLRHLRREGQL